MKARIMKVILLVLLAVALCAVPFVFAAEHGAATMVGESQVRHGGEAVHEVSEAAAGTEHEGVSEAAHEVEHHSPMITATKLKDLFWRTANFIGLVLILVKFLAKPISSGLSGRRRQIKEELEDLEDKRDEAERSYKDFVSRLAGMEEEMDGIVEKAIAQAVVEKTRILEEAERAAEDIKRQAEAAVQAELVDARRILRDEVAEQAAAMAEELIVKNLTAEDQVAITEQYLERVGAVQ